MRWLIVSLLLWGIFKGFYEANIFASVFDVVRLAGRTPALPPDYAEIPDNVVNTLPHYADNGCSAIGVVPTDIAQGINNPIPADFNPRPITNPSP